jgi:CRISPR-associated protein (TIGR03984 family)
MAESEARGNRMTTKLNTYSQKGISFCEALKIFASMVGQNRSVAILYSPKSCQIATFKDGNLQDHLGNTVNLESVFEARVFNLTSELRWLNDPSLTRNHRTTILTEQDFSNKLEKFNCLSTIVIDTIDQKYLVWGEGTGKKTNDGWSELATARIGSLLIPLNDVGNNQRVSLNSREYLIEEDHGNVIVFDERLIKFEEF